MEIQQPLSSHRARTIRRSTFVSRYFYVGVGLLSLFLVASGFSFTYFVPLSSGRFSAPILYHIHGLMFFAWIVLVVTQPLLIRFRYIKAHRKIGYAAFALALGMLITGIAMSLVSGSKAVISGDALYARAFLIVPFTDMILFGSFITLSLVNLRNPDTHKRLMVLATLSILPAAFGRLLGNLGLDSTTISGFIITLFLMDSILFLGMINDAITRKKIHPVYIFGGLAIIIVHAARFPLGQTSWWTTIAQRIIG